MEPRVTADVAAALNAARRRDRVNPRRGSLPRPQEGAALADVIILRLWDKLSEVASANATLDVPGASTAYVWGTRTG